jgi:mono/diheme cytochrome c family protein
MRSSLALLLVYAVLLAACTPAATPAAQPTAALTQPPAPTATAIPPTPTESAPPTEVPPTATAAPTEAAPTEAAPTAAAEPTTAAPEPTATSAPPAATPKPALAAGDPVVGKELWTAKTCIGCHGANAEGNIGPKLAGTGLGFDQVLLQVRVGAAPMPAFTAEQISDQDVAHILAWLKSLAVAPAPAPAASQPTYPIGALTAMWQHANDMKVKSDFAKDLPERQAQDDAGRLGILKQFAAEAAGQAQTAVAQGNQALNEVTDENVRASIRRTIESATRVADLANQAQGRGSFGEAYPLAAEMVRISRLDAWPLATQAVRDAGLTGTVRVQVVNPAGQPIPNAFVTVLTAHTPMGARTDASGRATISGVAAVPALQVKAYADGLVYHEVHVNLAPGATADARIALPGPSAGGQTPAVANAIVEPASGPGNGAVTLRVTATDPQGGSNLAEDQIFALNPALGQAFILRSIGGNQYQAQVQLPNLPAGAQTWHFFAVDHQCNTSSIIPVNYTVQ